MSGERTSRRTGRRRGTILIVAIWIVFGLAGLVLVFARSMRVEALASGNEVATVQAASIERGAEQYVLWLVEQQKEAVLTMTEDNFQAVQVGDGYFWIVRPNYGDDQLPKYGLVDEASKINVNGNLGALDMTALPGMDQNIVDAIRDWRDADSDVSTNGAEDEYYMSLPTPYYCKNGNLESVEELLLVKGFTRQLLYGVSDRPSSIGDLGTATASPLTNQLGATASTPAVTDPVQANGLFDYLTVYSSEPAASASAQPPVNVAGTDAQAINTLLQENFDQATAARYSQAHLARRMAARASGEPAFVSTLDFAVRTGMGSADFGKIADRVTATTRPSTGLIDVNTASREVLACLPGLDTNDVSNLISQRSGSNVDRTTIAWVLDALPKPTDNGPSAPVSKAGAVGVMITARAYQYSADIVAVSANGRSYQRYRIVVDASSQTDPPRIRYRKDITVKGWPLDPQILADLRAGRGVQGTATNQQSLARSGT